VYLTYFEQSEEEVIIVQFAAVVPSMTPSKFVFTFWTPVSHFYTRWRPSTFTY